MESVAMIRPSTHKSRPWQPGVWRRLPWTGLAAILGALVGICAAVAILVTSDGVPIRSWRYQPTVYLSIAYTLTNILIAIALGNGATISWWIKAMGTGNQLGDLHRHWSQGANAYAALTAGRHFNFIAFACLLAALTPINGPLLQRSTSVVLETTRSTVDLRIAAAPSIQDATGYLSGRGYDVSLISDDFAPVVQAFYNGDAVSANNTGCSGDGTCSGRLTAAGFAVNCSTYTQPFSVVSAGAVDGVYNVSNDPTVINGTYVFMSDFLWDTFAPGNISLNIQYKNAAPCEGTLMVQNCSLRAATVQYPVIVDGNKSTITLDPSTSILDDVVESVLSYIPMNEQGPSALGGFAFALQNRYHSTSHLRWVGAVGYELLSTGSTGPQFAVLTDVLQSSDPFNNGLCNITFSSPTSDLLEQAREFMFRTALAAGNTSTVQSVNAVQVATTNVYRTHYDIMAIAVALTLLVILVVSGAYHGYWRLGRSVSMSPIEIAKAFNAPLLAEQDSNAEVKELVDAVGGVPVRYGVVTGDIGGFHGYQDKIEPTVGVGEADRHSGRHLEIADAAIVQAPTTL